MDAAHLIAVHAEPDMLRHISRNLDRLADKKERESE